MPAADKLAFDRSVRRYDEFGRLHVELTNISKAAVNGYYGKEIPDAEALGLDPEKLYQLYRDPKELEKAAPTFNGVQVLSTHIGVSASQPREEYVAGSTGTDAVFEAPYLRNSLVIWRQEDIDGIESEEKIELSCSYKYRAAMEPGTAPDGTRYDGRMVDIVGNHVALVEKGRAGSDVLVGDSMPLQTRQLSNWESYVMPANLSNHARVIQGALAAIVLPKLAKDQKVDFRQVVLGTTSGNFSKAKPVILQRLTAALSGKLAKDEQVDMASVHALLDRLEGEEAGKVEDAEPGMEMEMEDLDDPGMDGAMKKARDAWVAAKAARDAKRAKDETPEQRAEREKREKEAADKRAKDKAKDEETAEEKTAREERESAEREKAKADDKKAMDAAVKSAVDAAVAGANKKNADLREAEREVQPYIGALPGIGELALAQDSAIDVYRLALDHLQVDLKDVPTDTATYKAILRAQPKPGEQRRAPVLARDAAGGDDFAKKFPAAAAVRTI